MIEIGGRIGALRNSGKETVYLFGFGTFQGDHVPPDDVQGPFGHPGLYGWTNPKLVMDDGTVIWGCESWWGDEEKIIKTIAGRRVEIVKPERRSPTDEERTEASEIMESARQSVESIVKEIEEAGKG